MKTVYCGVPFEGTLKEFNEFRELVDNGVFKSSIPTSKKENGTQKRKVLTEEEKEAKRQEKNAQHKAEQKEWFNNLTETEQKEFIAKKEEQRAKRTYMQAINASRLNVQNIISKKYKGARIPTETYNSLFKAEMKKYGYDWSPKNK